VLQGKSRGALKPSSAMVRGIRLPEHVAETLSESRHAINYRMRVFVGYHTTQVR